MTHLRDTRLDSGVIDIRGTVDEFKLQLDGVHRYCHTQIPKECLAVLVETRKEDRCVLGVRNRIESIITHVCRPELLRSGSEEFGIGLRLRRAWRCLGEGVRDKRCSCKRRSGVPVHSPAMAVLTDDNRLSREKAQAVVEFWTAPLSNNLRLT